MPLRGETKLGRGFLVAWSWAPTESPTLGRLSCSLVWRWGKSRREVLPGVRRCRRGSAEASSEAWGWSKLLRLRREIDRALGGQR